MSKNNAEKEAFSFNVIYFIGLYFLMFWVGLFPSVIVAYWYFVTFPFSLDPVYLLILIPLFIGLYGLALLVSVITTKIGIWIIHKRIVYPEPGSYPMSMEEPQTHAFVLKGNLKSFGRWIFYFFHLRFLRTFWLRQMGCKIGKNVKYGIYVQDEEFIEIGDNTFMAENTILSGHLMDQNALTINETIVGKNCIFEPYSGSVGGTIGDNSFFKNLTGVMKGQICRGNAIYYGFPCKKVGDLSDLSPVDIEKIKQDILEYDKIDFIKKKNEPIKINGTKLFLMKLAIVLGGCIFGFIFPFLFGLFFQNVYSTTNHLANIFLIALIPIVFLVALGVFIFGVVMFTKIFLVYYDRKGDIPEGTYELEDPRTIWFKIKYCLRMFGLRLFHGAPFRIADTFALRFWGQVKLGKVNLKIDDGIVDPQYLEVGDNSQIAAGARVHTHDIIDGKLYIKTVKIGRNVMVGTYSHLKPGVEIADDSVCGVGVWFRKNRKCKRHALWLGKPAYELPLSILTKSARLKGKYVD